MREKINKHETIIAPKREYAIFFYSMAADRMHREFYFTHSSAKKKLLKSVFYAKIQTLQRYFIITRYMRL